MERKLTQEQMDEVLKISNKEIVYHPYLRKGQSFFNTLYHMYPKHAEEIRATRYDPFYQDEILEICMQYLTGTLAEETNNPILAELSKITDSGMNAFWDKINTYIYESYPNATEEQKEDAFDQIAKKAKLQF